MTELRENTISTARPPAGTAELTLEPIADWRICRFSAVVFIVALCGCVPEPEPPPPPPKTTEQLATEKYHRLISEVRRRMEAASDRGGVGGGGPLVNWSTEVTDKLIPPPEEGLLWRGKVTVVTKSSVTVISMPPPEEQAEKPRKQEDRNDLINVVETGDPDLDKALSEVADAGKPINSSTPSMHVIDDDKTDVYDLIFEDGSWRLLTEVDEESEMGLIFRIAIRSQ